MKLEQIVKLDEMKDEHYDTLVRMVKSFLYKALNMKRKGMFNVIVRDHVAQHNRKSGATGLTRDGTKHNEYRAEHLNPDDAYNTVVKFAQKYLHKIIGWANNMSQEMEGVIWDEEKKIQVIIAVDYGKGELPYNFKVISMKHQMEPKKPRPGDKRFYV